MKFYTNVVLVGNEILSRGFDNGEHFENRESFYPTLFVSTNKKSKYKTLEGNYVDEVKPGTIRETREFISKYENIDNFTLYYTMFKYSIKDLTDTMIKNVPKILLNSFLSIL